MAVQTMTETSKEVRERILPLARRNLRRDAWLRPGQPGHSPPGSGFRFSSFLSAKPQVVPAPVSNRARRHRTGADHTGR